VTTHDLWHIAVLGSTLFAAAGVAILALGSLIWDETPPGVTKARPLILGLVAIAGILLVAEWTGVH
jgi:hypothetical protein